MNNFRTGGNITHRIWQPSITENTEYNKFQHSVFNVPPTNTQKMEPPIVPLKVSLEHQNPVIFISPELKLANPNRTNTCLFPIFSLLNKNYEK